MANTIYLGVTVVCAAVQVERRPGRPSLQSSARPVPPRPAPPPRFLINIYGGEDAGEGEGEEQNEEKSLLHHSLSRFKLSLNSPGPSPPSLPSSLDPAMFEPLSPALLSFSLVAPVRPVLPLNIQLVSETASRVLFLSVSPRQYALTFKFLQGLAKNPC